jgi:magnesium transporter
MLNCYQSVQGKLEHPEHDCTQPLPASTIWIDLMTPTMAEEKLVETLFGINVPTEYDMHEIEASSRLYSENEAIFLTAQFVERIGALTPVSIPITFILKSNRLITLRYAESLPLRVFRARLRAQAPATRFTGESILLDILEIFVDRDADLLERVSESLEQISRKVFDTQDDEAQAQQLGSDDFKTMLRKIGNAGGMTLKARESAVSVSRLLGYLAKGDYVFDDLASRDRIKSINRDLRSLTEHTSFLSDRVDFMLDATLGMINIEQNAIIKIVSVAAVVFLPPTVIASIYGMNFEHMPELHWLFGYPMALGLMVISAILPYFIFKHRGWL